MIQRKQTIFLLLSCVFAMVCLCLPIGFFTPEGMGVDSTMYNLWIVLENGQHDYSVWPLFAILLVACTVNLVDVFLYKNRILQARLCLLSMFLFVLWYAVYAFFGFSIPETLKASFHVDFCACLPFISMILTFLARKGILADERLVRSMDRIR